MTYRRDSTFYCPYGQLVQRDNGTDLPEILKLRLLRRPKLVSWVVSKCNTHSGRERYVKELSKYLQIDIYGKCGRLILKRSRSWEIRYLGAKYKFRITFENSVCEDYFTERFFDSLLSYTVPIVLRRTDYEKIAPGSSFIAIDDFRNVRQLAEYIRYLDLHDEEYLRYFEWQKTKAVEMRNICFCDLCAALHEKKKIVETGSELQHFHAWWHIGNKCIPKFVSSYM
ncbi:unnamed protein product [Soboliphyme baturini]|uniref:Fucosyltransferase n=1 Tax=Soboliphyme baturini TaxID=241478 RepID=A0A183IZ41_9BILA|nr:unnamed protein product [Soboliphyme baturini]